MTRQQLSEQLVDLIPTAAHRAVRGAELVANGNVKHMGGARFLVDSESRSDWAYEVNVEHGTCDCPDFWAPVEGDTKFCKHFCASWLVWRILQEVRRG